MNRIKTIGYLILLLLSIVISAGTVYGSSDGISISDIATGQWKNDDGSTSFTVTDTGSIASWSVGSQEVTQNCTFSGNGFSATYTEMGSSSLSSNEITTTIASDSFVASGYRSSSGYASGRSLTGTIISPNVISIEDHASSSYSTKYFSNGYWTYTNCIGGNTRTYYVNANTPVYKPLLSVSSGYFGDVTSQTGEITKSITMSNMGSSSLQIGALSITDDAASEFTLKSDDCSGKQVEPGKTCSVVVLFTPKILGAKSANLAIPSNDARNPLRNLYLSATKTGFILNVNVAGVGKVISEPAGIDCGSDCNELYPTPKDVTLQAVADTYSQFAGWEGGGCTGTGNCTVRMDKDIAVKASFALNSAAVIPSSSDFGTIGRGSISNGKSFTVSNNGAVPFKIGNVVIEGSDAASFLIGSNACSGKTLSQNQTCVIMVSFSPDKTASHAADLSIAIAEPANQTLKATLQGQGTDSQIPSFAPKITVSPSYLNFVNDIYPASRFIVQNNGTTDGLIASISIDGYNKGEFFIQTDSCTGIVLKGGTFCAVDVAFSPVTTGWKSASLTVKPTFSNVYSISQDQFISTTNLYGSVGDILLSTINTNNDVGQYTSLAIDQSGNVHISYLYVNNSFANEKWLVYSTNASGSWVTTYIDGNNVGQYTSLAIDQSGKVHISYYDLNYKRLKYATNASGSWVTTYIDGNNVGSYTSLAIDQAGKVHISYYDGTNGALKYATNASGVWVTSTIDTGYVGSYTSLAIDQSGKVHISYYDGTNGALKYATNASGVWVTSTIDTGYVGSYTSLAIDQSGKVHISYYAYGYYKYATNASGAWVTSIIDSNNGTGAHTSLAIDQEGKVHIGYCDVSNGALKYSTNASGAWLISTIDSTNYVGAFTSLAIDQAGKVHISYYDSLTRTLKFTGDLKYAVIVPQAALLSVSVTKQGTGLGTVTSTSPLAIVCGAVCSASLLSKTIVTLNASPSSNSTFTGWSGCDTTDGFQCTVTVAKAQTVTATFSINTYAITADTNGNGAITSPGDGTVNYGTNKTYTIAPNTGYHVVDVLADGTSVGPVTSYTFNNVKEAHTISAVFAIDTFSIKSTAGIGGIILPSGTVSVNYNADFTAAIIPDAGYRVVDVKADGVSIGPETSYTFSQVKVNHTIEAAFDPILQISPAAYNYSDTGVGNVSLAQIFTITNTGATPLALTGIAISDMKNFSLNLGDGENPCGNVSPTIPARGSCTFSVRFHPSAITTFTAPVTITFADTSGQTQISLTGKGIQTDIQSRYPFCGSGAYPNGIMPTGRNCTHAETAYLHWKDGYVTSDGAQGLRRVKGGACRGNVSDCTTSEGIGYGMLLAVNYNDKALFDDLLGYYNKHKDVNGLMNLKISAAGEVIGANSATDADEDVAFALILADKQWGSGSVNYRQNATDLINSIMDHEVEVDTFVLKPGDVWGGSDVTNPSYFAPAYYRVFQTVTGDARWNNVISKSYEILAKAANPITGLAPDWCKADGTAADGKSHDYGYDAVRTPLRIAMDYLWYGEPKALSFTRKITDFAIGKGITNIKDGYSLDGTLLPAPLGQWHNSPFVGTFATAAMATDATYQSFCNDAYTENVNVAGDNYYNASIRTLSLFLQTGNLLYPQMNYTQMISISSPSATVTKSGPVTYTVTYTGAKTVGLAAADIQLNKTGTANGTITVSGTGNTTRTVTISGITSDGTLGISIGAGTASDNAGNLAAASAASTTFTVDNTIPVVSITQMPAVLTNLNTANFTILPNEGFTFIYKLDGIIVTSPILTDLRAGSHTFEVIAIDTAGNPSAPISYTWTVDITAPVITTTSPANGASNIGVNSVLTVIFSKPMAGASITGATFTVKTGTSLVAGVVSYNSALNSASFTSANALVAGKTYTATAAAGMQDLAGNSLASDYVWTFNTVMTGDINGDASVDLTDAILAIQVMARMTPTGVRSDYASSGADMSGDGKIGLQEVIYIMQTMAGMRQ